jgi:hypothetical protein
MPKYLILTPDERRRYGVYGDMREFRLGFDDYNIGRRRDMGEGAAAQSYDRGQECAMQRQKLQEAP